MLFYVCRMTEDGQWEGLRSTHDEDYAEQLIDYYCEKYPHAYIELMIHEEFHSGVTEWQAMAI